MARASGCVHSTEITYGRMTSCTTGGAVEKEATNGLTARRSSARLVDRLTYYSALVDTTLCQLRSTDSGGRRVQHDRSEYRELLREEFPHRYRALLPGAISTAYVAVANVMGAVEFLKLESAEGLHGDLVRCAVDLQLTRLIDAGEIDLEYRWEFHSRPTGKHLEIITERAKIVPCQLRWQNEFPRAANFRDNQRLNNDPPLPFDDVPVESDESRFQVILGHGHHSRVEQHRFIFLGLPHSESRYYNYRTRNLLAALRLVDETPSEHARDQVDPPLRDELREELRRRATDDPIKAS